MFDQISIAGGSPPVPNIPSLPDLNSGKAYPFKKVGETEDIFGGTEKSAPNSVERPSVVSNFGASLNNIKPNVLQQPQQRPINDAQKYNVMPQKQNHSNMPPNYSGNKQGGMKFLTIMVIILALIALGVVGYWAYGKYFAKKAEIIEPVDNTFDNAFDSLNDLQNLNQEDNNANSENEEANNNENQNDEPTTTVDLLIDSDGDLLTDAEEANLGTNSTRVDSDFDGLSDYDEVNTWQTDPTNPDSDGDTYLDGVEVDNGYDPLGAGKLIQ
jgi:type II secretory pathway pseudopilin PulG